MIQVIKKQTEQEDTSSFEFFLNNKLILTTASEILAQWINEELTDCEELLVMQPIESPDTRIIKNGCPQCGSDLLVSKVYVMCVNWQHPYQVEQYREGGKRNCDYALLSG